MERCKHSRWHKYHKSCRKEIYKANIRKVSSKVQAKRKPGFPVASTSAPPSSTGDASTIVVEKPSLSRFSGVSRLEPSPNLVESHSTCLALSRDSPAKGVCTGMSTVNRKHKETKLEA